MISRSGKFLVRLAVALALGAVFAALAVFLWLPVLRPPISARLPVGELRQRAKVPPTHWLYLRDGSIVACSLRLLDANGAHLVTPSGAELNVARGDIVAFSASPWIVPIPDRSGRDLVRLRGGSDLSCTVLSVADGSMTISVPVEEREETTAMPMRRVLFASFSTGDIRASLSLGGAPTEDALRILRAVPYTRAEVLPGGGALVAVAERNEVLEIDPRGELVWHFSAPLPRCASRLPNGNTLVCAYGDGKVLEVTRAGETVWAYSAAGPVAARKLPNGSVLIAENHKNRLIEVDPDGAVVWTAENLPNVSDCFRTPDGNTLAVVTEDEVETLVKLDCSGEVLWRFKNLPRRSFIARATPQFVEIANTSPGRFVYIDQMGGFIFEKHVPAGAE